MLGIIYIFSHSTNDFYGFITLVMMIILSVFMLGKAMIKNPFSIKINADQMMILYLFRKRIINNANLKDYAISYKSSLVTLYFIDNHKPILLYLTYFKQEDRNELTIKIQQILLNNTKDFSTKKWTLYTENSIKTIYWN